jgi:predicted NodU family carbamoyl transferase
MWRRSRSPANRGWAGLPFNENEPIVNTPAEALDCFLRTRMDRLVLGDVVVSRGA